MEVLTLFNQGGSRKLQLALSFLRLLSSLIIMHLFNRGRDAHYQAPPA
jgi:hypothetical protein